uniref:Myb-like domain-containing protein n=1 Tax=Populus davidiana TaxID=266767 RepID=A0A6M2EAY3_9ROSI
MPSALMQTHDREPPCFQRESNHLLITTDPKPRLRWTLELHERFVDAVTLVSPAFFSMSEPYLEATPKAIMRIMGVKGLTLYHLKSHLQVNFSFISLDFQLHISSHLRISHFCCFLTMYTEI